jgi:hypothetical protein
MPMRAERRPEQRSRCSATMCAALVAGCMSLATAARADTASENKAAAEALFQQGKKLLADGKYAEACSKLASSHQLDPATGTLMNLGDCLEKNGQVASAWATFKEAVSMAKATGQPQREQVAQFRASSLEPRLPQLLISVAPGDSSVAEIKRDGAVVPRVVWGTTLPVDPGEHVVQADGPGRRTWSQRVIAIEAKTANVTVPVLEIEGAAPKEPASPPPPVAAIPAPAPAAIQSAPPATPSAAPVPAQPSAPPSEGMPGQKIGALIAGGVGFAAMATGGIIGLRARSKYGSADCGSDNHCSLAGFNDRTSAQSTARTASWVFAGGAAVLATGAVLWLTAPSAASAGPKVGARPMVGPDVAGVAVGGAW